MGKYKFLKLLVCFFILPLSNHINAETRPIPIEAYVAKQQIKFGLKSVDGLPFYLALRKDGKLKLEEWGIGWNNLATSYGKQAKLKKNIFNQAEVNLFYNEKLVPPNSQFLQNIHRGIKGFSFEAEGKVFRYSPTQMLAQNKSFKKLLKPFKNKKITAVRIFDTHQFFINLNSTADKKIIPAFRGNQLIPLDQVTQESVKIQRGQTLIPLPVPI